MASNTKYSWDNLVLLIALLFSGPLTAQFSGGPGDGFAVRLTVQLTFDGLPAGTRALYTGGPGDGFDRAGRTLALSGQSFTLLYGGGGADGFDYGRSTRALSGIDLAVVFSGGPGDGFDWMSTNALLSGNDLSGLFSGGPGDGFDRLSINALLTGGNLAELYLGGPGDGFDNENKNLLLSGTSLASLYSGGPGDGFDFLAVSAVLTGLDLSALFAGGSGDGFDAATFSGVVPLPLTLVSFEAIAGEQFVLLRWVTEDEEATDFFTIEKTVDGQEFAGVGTAEAAGYSEPGVHLHYEMEDNEPYAGTSYYRLQTTDFDGAISLSHLVAVQFSDAKDWGFNLFPNPNTGRHFNLSMSGLELGDHLIVEVYDATGRKLLSERYEYTGGNSRRFELTGRLTGGSYLIRIEHPELGQLSKVLIVK